MIVFEVGGTYENRVRQYIVREIRGDELLVEYDDGSMGTLSVSTQSRIIENMQAELNRIASGTSDSQAFFSTLGFLAARADLQAEVPPKAQSGFAEKYLDTSGLPVRHDTPGYYPLMGDSDKWGPELRIYFRASEAELNRVNLGQFITIRDGTAPQQYRVNNNDLFYRLVQLGFCLGPAQDFTRIRGRIPNSMQATFEESYREAIANR